jgi:hypothetical protein
MTGMMKIVMMCQIMGKSASRAEKEIAVKVVIRKNKTRKDIVYMADTVIKVINMNEKCFHHRDRKEALLSVDC